MVYIKKIFLEDNTVSYFYQPENVGRYGEISFNIKDESYEILMVAEEDDNDHVYIRHVLKKLKEYKYKNNFPEEEAIKWY
ncbi:MAG: hypothetical protein GX275_11210 [Clostridiales bacterium]|nr:hypothetical protein [Clostridiales bacterium]